MPKDKGKESPLSQVLVAVAITLLVGGTAPWWWHEVGKLVMDGSGSDPVMSRRAPESEPEHAVRKLLAAWDDTDRNTALSVAERSVVDKLFGAPSLKVNSKELTCYPVGTGQRDCQIPHTNGVLVFRLAETDRGWWIESVEY